MPLSPEAMKEVGGRQVARTLPGTSSKAAGRLPGAGWQGCSTCLNGTEVSMSCSGVDDPRGQDSPSFLRHAGREHRVRRQSTSDC